MSRAPREIENPGAGQGLVEYALILGLSALLAVVILVFFGSSVSAALEIIGHAIDEATRGR